MPDFFDVHTHTEFIAFQNDYREVIKRALDRGVWLNSVGSEKTSSERSVRIANEYKKGVYATVGLHPIHVGERRFDPEESVSEEIVEDGVGGFDYNFFRNLAADPKVVAIGECGLDYFHLEKDNRKEQMRVFEEQIRFAGEIKKPLMIHCRDAYGDLIAVLKKREKELSPSNPGIIHFFSGTSEDASVLLEMGFSFSFGGAVTFSGSYDEVLRMVPIENMLLETDAPYVAPVPFRGQRNEPAYVIRVADYIAKVRNFSLEEISRRTVLNAFRIFAIESQKA